MPRVIPSLAAERCVCVAVGNAFCMVTTAAGALYAFGTNDFGELGLGHTNNVAVPTRVAAIGGAVRSVCAGSYHAACITGDGRVWSWGNGYQGKLGHGDYDDRSLPKAVASTAFAAKQITAGSYCTLVLHTDDAIWVTGRVRFGGPSSATFTRVQFPDTPGLPPLRFVQVSITWEHVVALTTDGGLFSWGRGEGGRLGHSSTENINVPRLVTALKDVPIASAAAGYRTSLVLARSGEVWSWGTGLALGHGGDEQSQQLLPRVIGVLGAGASIRRVATGSGIAACANADGSLWIWGGVGTGAGASSTPTAVAW